MIRMYSFARPRRFAVSDAESLISDAFAFSRGARGLTTAETYFSVGSSGGRALKWGRGYVDEIS